jgi:hypothetical protein
MSVLPEDGKGYGQEIKRVDLLSLSALPYHHCFRPVMLTSLSAAAGVVLLQAVRTRNSWKATSHGVFVFCAAASLLWPLCRVQQHKRTEGIRKLLDRNAVGAAEQQQPPQPPQPPQAPQAPQA